MRHSLYLLVTLVLLLLAACGDQTAVPAQPDVEPAPGTATDSEETNSDNDMAGEEMVDEEMASDAMVVETAVGDRPAWQQIPLTNALSGETFTIADFAGKTVFVEPMATWCTNCRQQLINVAAARSQVGDDVVFIALSVEPNLRDEVLAGYANGLGFDWIFAVATPEMLQALVDEFGRTITNPPATPHFIVRPDGSTTDLTTGIESADELVVQIQAAAQ